MSSGAVTAARATGPADVEIVERAREGDHEAFRVLVERYQSRAYRLALRVLRDEEQARDAVQDAFLKAYGSLDRFQGRSGFYTWLYRIVMNQCLDRKRRDKSDRELEWDDVTAARAARTPAAGSFEGEGAGPAPDVAAERGELRQVLEKAIAELPDDARRTIELREIDGLSYREIAEALGVPKGTVMSRLHYARRRLQESLRSAGIDPLAEGAGETA
ncbi:MAG: RNA polymerase subunit sigma-24 [Deltaproteobacteria bacterium]|nr:RNA polymerase subunit sigma-24 [Deltaproteobacteria bacterium]